MANESRTNIQVIGSNVALARVDSWLEELRKVKPTKKDPYAMNAIAQVFHPSDATFDPGTKWVYFDESCVDAESSFCFRSAWNPPFELIKLIACQLHAYDPNVVLRCFYETEGEGFGIVYCSSTASSEAILVERQLDYIDSFDEEADIDSELNTLEDELLFDDFLWQMPHLIPVLRETLTHLKDSDWDGLLQSINKPSA